MIHDAGNTLDLTIDFIKVPGGIHGGNWGARIKGEPHPDAPADQPTSLLFYAAMEGSGSIEVGSEPEELGYTDDVRLAGAAPGLGEFKIDVTRGPASNKYPEKTHPSYDDKPLDRTMVSSLKTEPSILWQAKSKC